MVIKVTLSNIYTHRDFRKYSSHNQLEKDLEGNYGNKIEQLLCT